MVRPVIFDAHDTNSGKRGCGMLMRAFFLLSLLLFGQSVLAVPPNVQAPIGPINVPEDSPAIIINLNTVFFDADGDPMTFTIDSNSNATVVGAAISGANLTVTPNLNQNGLSAITIRATAPNFP